jgi:hypothetical protein
MPFDPSLPAPNSPLESQVIRDQFQALFNLINNIATVNAAQVDATTTLPPGAPANVSVSVVGDTRPLAFHKASMAPRATKERRGHPLPMPSSMA